MTPVNVAPSHPVDGGHVVYAADQPEYNPLPVWKRQDGRVVSRWRLTWRERLAALFGRSLYVEVMTFGSSLQPIFLTFSEDEALYADTQTAGDDEERPWYDPAEGAR